MEMFLFVALALGTGILIGWLVQKLKNQNIARNPDVALQNAYSALEKGYAELKGATAAEKNGLLGQIADRERQVEVLNQRIAQGQQEVKELERVAASLRAAMEAAQEVSIQKRDEMELLKRQLQAMTEKYNAANEQLATARATVMAQQEKLELQKQEIEGIGKKFNLEFETIASRILDTKAAKFTELNRNNLSAILEPLGNNIQEFKTKVEEVYLNESRERFSLGEKVKELAELNREISAEAQNLTRALKGEAKTQGRWGEMILESILEKSGLRKDEEYFMEFQLADEAGVAMRSDAAGKKMRPDAVIKYPDNRSVIIDSKVSLNAYTRYVAATDAEEQKRELAAHVAAVKAHIVALSTKGYDDFNRALDFVMMFIPSEPAYIAAVQGDPDLWNYAYDRRILLMNPTNLITSLKLIVDLWKREYQNQNALAIAERGAKLHDKFVAFVENLEKVGASIEKAQDCYTDAFKQLSTGRDNLVSQATKLRELGVKNKKSMNASLTESASDSDLEGLES